MPCFISYFINAPLDGKILGNQYREIWAIGSRDFFFTLLLFPFITFTLWQFVFLLYFIMSKELEAVPTPPPFGFQANSS